MHESHLDDVVPIEKIQIRPVTDLGALAVIRGRKILIPFMWMQSPCSPLEPGDIATLVIQRESAREHRLIA